MAITTELAARPLPPDSMRPLLYRVRRKSRETRDTFTLVLAADDPAAGEYAFAPGQFNMLYAFGVGESPISMSGAAGPTRAIIHTIRAVGPVTHKLDRLRPGDGLGLRGPFGTSWPVAEAHGRDVVLIAGGIGLAPLRPAIYHVLAERERYGRIVILYGARTPADLLFAREVESWRGRFDVDVEVTVDHAKSGWRGLVGVVTTLIPRAHFDPSSAVAFVCGPEMMMGFVARELMRRGMAAPQIHVSLERNMKCAVGLCGHCQFGPLFVCKDGPVFPYDRVSSLLGIREL